MHRFLKRRALLATGLSIVPGIIVAGDLLSRRKLVSRCSIPVYNYQPHRFTDPVSEESLRAIPYLADGSGAAVPVPGGGTERLKTFQMAATSLTKDHCRISQVTVTITNTGRWMVRLTQQHPGQLVTAQLRPQFERYQRNLFRVDIRPVGLMTLQHTESVASIGKPEFPCVPTLQFWIQKDQTQQIHRWGESPELARWFDVIEQVEIHFSYR